MSPSPESNPPADASADSQPSAAPTKPQLLVPPDRLGHASGDVAAFASHIPSSLQHINWEETLPVTKLFRGFRVAIHPSKLLLSLVAVLLIYSGMRLLDGAYKLLPENWQAVPNEPALYEASLGTGSDFAEVVRQTREEQEAAIAYVTRSAAVTLERPAEEVGRGDLITAVERRRDERLAGLAEARDRRPRNFWR